MLRDPNLIPLSRQHQHALALCVRIERALRAGPVATAVWQDEIARDFEQEIQFHLSAEEAVLFPTATKFAQLKPLVDELLAEHARLRTYFMRAKDGMMNGAELGEFSSLLSSHIRKEERRLFEELQKVLSPDEMNALGAQLGNALRDAARACGIRRLV